MEKIAKERNENKAEKAVPRERSLSLSRSLFSFFEMAAMPFFCNGILLFQWNLPRILSVLVLNC